MIRRAVRILDTAKGRAASLKARAYALAPWAISDAAADRRADDGSPGARKPR